MMIVESIFLVDCLTSFIKDYEDPLDPKGPSIRKLSKIFTNYTSNAFIYDAIALMPLNWLTLYRNRQNLLFILKCIRLKRGIENLDVLDYLNIYKARVAKGIESKIKKQKAKAKKEAESKKNKNKNLDPMLYEDQTKLDDILKCGLLLQLIRIIIILAVTSYFAAMLFRFCIQL